MGPLAKPYVGDNSQILKHAEVDSSPIRMEELEEAFRKPAKNKSACVDDIPTEAWQWLQPINRQCLLDLFNNAVSSQTIPQRWQTALVVEIYRGKGMADPNNSRPTTLLSIAYKLLARTLQQRLEKALEPYLRDTQYGFRSGRATSHPIYVVRRLLERAERTESSLYVLLLLLDWKQAFDRVNVQALEVSLRRYGVPNNTVNLITSIYTSQHFTVKAAGQTRETLEAKSGI